MNYPEEDKSGPSAIKIGAKIPSISLRITRAKMALVPAVTLDMYAGHHSDEYAKSIGFSAVFMNTMPLVGLLDRHVTDWAGPLTQIARHAITLIRPVFAGDELIVSGHVSGFDERTLPSGKTQKLLCVKSEITSVAGDLKCRGSVSVVWPDDAPASR